MLAQSSRKVVVLDMNNYISGLSVSRRTAIPRSLQTIGVPFDTTTELSKALLYPIVITGTYIDQSSFSVSERNQLINYVSNGGVLISCSLRDTALFSLCGIGASVSSDTLTQITLDTTAAPIFDFISDSMEVVISIGDTAHMPNFYTRYFNVAGGTQLGYYENNKAAFVKNNVGLGTTYLFGFDFRDITFRNQINMDVSAQRVYSNGFEPSSDVFYILLRNIIRQHIPHTVSKYTIPGNKTSVLLITHDVDSETAMDTMLYFSEYEKTNAIIGHYNITTRYFHDDLMSDFYVGSYAKVQELVNDGHVIASHSVGRFPDFYDKNIFPLGYLGNTEANYTPAHFSGITTGGTVLGELEVSKNLLETDHGVKIRSFRAGHLCFNDSLMLGLDTLGYEFNSTNAANDVLTSFPYYGLKIQSFNSIEVPVLEIPMTISDVFSDINESNYGDKVDIWVDACERYDANHAPVVLLIHPNRQYKLEAEKELLSRIPVQMGTYSFENYGRFWRKRDSLLFHTELTGNELHVVFENNLLSVQQSFVIDYNGLDTVLFMDSLGNYIDFTWIPWDNGTRLYYQEDALLGIVNLANTKQEDILVYPNPTHGEITISVPQNLGKAHLTVFDLAGRKLLDEHFFGKQKTVQLNESTMKPGTYVLLLEYNNTVSRKKFVYFD